VCDTERERERERERREERGEGRLFDFLTFGFI
jgi:hypothetical protein